MKKVYKVFPYEFLFLINGNPIVGRNFPIHRYNRDSICSIELKEIVDDCVDILKNHFKNNSYDYLYRYYNPFHRVEENTDQVKNIYENEDIFTFQIKVHGDVVAERMFSGNDYPPKVRYDVDIRKIIPEIIATIQRGLTLKNYTKEYCGYAL